MDNAADAVKEMIKRQAATVFLNEFMYYCLINGNSDDIDNEIVKGDLLELHRKYFEAAYNEALIDFTNNKSDAEIKEIMQAHLNLIKESLERSEMLEQLQDDSNNK